MKIELDAPMLYWVQLHICELGEVGWRTLELTFQLILVSFSGLAMELQQSNTNFLD
ncbi:hypothetical protein QM565_19280 [Geitlerinema splendidum]|nr:hypothetical protein [Geitlerinema splendidum]